MQPNILSVGRTSHRILFPPPPCPPQYKLILPQFDTTSYAISTNLLTVHSRKLQGEHHLKALGETECSVVQNFLTPLPSNTLKKQQPKQAEHALVPLTEI